MQKKHQPKAFKKYLEDALGECNEMNPHLIIYRDVYGIDRQLCDHLLSEYGIAGKQLYKLRQNWLVYGKDDPSSNIPIPTSKPTSLI